jgi:hypothetical protein
MRPSRLRSLRLIGPAKRCVALQPKTSATSPIALAAVGASSIRYEQALRLLKIIRVRKFNLASCLFDAMKPNRRIYLDRPVGSE